MSTKKGLPVLLAGEVICHVIIQRVLTKHDTYLPGLYEEGGPPTDVADKINASFPGLMGAALGYRSAKLIAEADK